ncbi:MAG: hypothetical protein MRY79_03465 [Alphaproteobacteria bacterium]|nr:hypothetical protein [Alphaproteobacteria bacterium]
MFSQLGPLFKTTFRHAESNDTRQKIPHEERDKGRKKREEDEQKASESQKWEDNTTVSVEALRAFLVNFLKTLPGGKESLELTKSAAQNTGKGSVRPPEKSRPTRTRDAKAARAYQAMAEKSQEVAPAPTTQANPRKNQPTADLLQSQELRDIHQLITDLDDLSNKGVQILQIKPASTFLESLKQAVRLLQK